MQEVSSVVREPLYDSQLLRAHWEGSEILQDITDNFLPKMKNFHVFLFWEQHKSNLGVKWDYVSVNSFPCFE